MIHYAIRELSPSCATLDDLAKNLQKRIEAGIEEKKPTVYEVSGPWKDYIKS